MVTQRRVFRAKNGASGAVVSKLKEFQPIVEHAGGPPRRIYTDLFSGESDRGVRKLDVEHLTALEEMTKSTTRIFLLSSLAWYNVWTSKAVKAPRLAPEAI